jgi:predicted GTPase
MPKDFYTKLGYFVGVNHHSLRCGTNILEKYSFVNATPKSMTTMQDVAGVVLVFSADSIGSFQISLQLAQQIQGVFPFVIIVANNISRTVVSKRYISEFKQLGFTFFMETDSSTGQGYRKLTDQVKQLCRRNYTSRTVKSARAH